MAADVTPASIRVRAHVEGVEETAEIEIPRKEFDIDQLVARTQALAGYPPALQYRDEHQHLQPLSSVAHLAEAMSKLQPGEVLVIEIAPSHTVAYDDPTTPVGRMLAVCEQAAQILQNINALSPGVVDFILMMTPPAIRERKDQLSKMFDQVVPRFREYVDKAKVQHNAPIMEVLDEMNADPKVLDAVRVFESIVFSLQGRHVPYAPAICKCNPVVYREWVAAAGQQSEYDGSNPCTFCQAPYRPSDYVVVWPCGHGFHASCADHWIGVNFILPSSTAECPFHCGFLQIPSHLSMEEATVILQQCVAKGEVADGYHPCRHTNPSPPMDDPCVRDVMFTRQGCWCSRKPHTDGRHSCGKHQWD